jgi:hypothetical protein
MAKYKSLQTTFLNGDELFNFGGFVPPVLFPDTQPASPTPTPTPTKTPTPTPSTTPASVSPTPTTTPTITPTQTTTPTLTPTKTSTPTPSPSPVVYSEYFGSGSTTSLACAAAETLELYSNEPFFSFGQFLYLDSNLTIVAPGMYLSAGDVVYFYDVFIGLQNAVSCPVPSPSPTPTSTITPTPTLTPTPTSTPTTFTAEYTAILSRASALGYTAPSYAQKVLQNQLIVDLKAAGYWAKLGNFYMFKVDLTGGGSSQFTLLNWITPTNPVCSLAIWAGYVNPPVHTTQGWQLTNQNYMLIGTNANASSVNPLTGTSVRNSEGTYVADFVANSSSGTNIMWCTDNNSWNQARYNNTAAHRIFRGTSLTDSYDFTGLGFKSATIDGVVTSDTNVYFQNNGIQTLKTKTTTDPGIGGGTLGLNGYGAGGQTLAFSWTCGFWWSGAGLSSADIPGFETIITNYMNA